MSDKGQVLCVSFRQSGGRLAGECWCGRRYSSADPEDMWRWLDDHRHAGEEGERGRAQP